MPETWFHPVLQTFAVGALLFIVTALAYSYTKAEWMMRVVRHGGLLDPLSALELSLAQRKRGPVSVVVIEWAAAQDFGATGDLNLRLRAMVRQGDDVIPVDQRRTAVVLGAPPERLGRILERWRLSFLVDANDRAVSRVGVAVPGDDGHSAEEILAAATSRFPSAEQEIGVLSVDSTNLPAQSETIVSEPEEGQAEFLDPVTELLKPGLMSGAARKWIASRRYRGRPVTVLQIHVYGWDSIVRRFGTDVGNAVLRACAEVLSANLREEDLLGRWAQDAFLAIVDCPPPVALKIAERLVACVRDSGVNVGAGRLLFTICVGLAGIGGTGSTPSHVIDAAGVAAAEAVRRGPGTCLVYDRSMERHQAVEPPVEDQW